eukprot:jgi/Mesvir1/14131/Mv23081-RA.1
MEAELGLLQREVGRTSKRSKAADLRKQVAYVEREIQEMKRKFEDKYQESLDEAADAAHERAKNIAWNEILRLERNLAQNETDIADAQRNRQDKNVRLLQLTRERIQTQIQKQKRRYEYYWGELPSTPPSSTPPRGTGPVTRSASAAARSEDIGGGAYSGGLDRDDDGGGGEADSGSSVPPVEAGQQTVEKQIRRQQELVNRLRDSVDSARSRWESAGEVLQRNALLTEAQKKLEELIMNPGGERAVPGRDILRMRDLRQGSVYYDQAKRKQAELLAAERASSADEEEAAQALSGGAGGAGGSGARSAGSGKQQSRGGGEEGSGDSTAESGPRTEQSWAEYLAELRGLVNKAVGTTETAKGDRAYMKEARDAVEALRKKAGSAPSARSDSESVKASTVLANACDKVLSLLSNSSFNVSAIAEAAQAMVTSRLKAEQAIAADFHFSRLPPRDESTGVIPTPPRPDMPGRQPLILPAPRRNVWLDYFRELRNMQDDVVEMTEKAIKDKRVSDQAFEAVKLLDEKLESAPSEYDLDYRIAFFSELVVRTMKCKRKTVTHGGRCKNEARPGRKTCAIHARGVHHVARSCGMHVARTKETKRKYDDMATGIPSAPATVADAVRLSWLSRFPGQTGAPTQEEAKKGK